jgi:hypothetical protein
MTSVPAGWSDAALDRMQFEADPLADRAVAALLRPWNGLQSEPSPGGLLEANADQWRRLAAVNRLFEGWTSNASVVGWHAPPGTPPDVAQAVESYLRDAPGLPAWADPDQIARAEALFMDHGVLSCTLLFCASLPECYVVPDLSLALHSTGQLEAHTEYRIRATAAMIFPVMMEGGLTRPEGAGRAQVLKVRLIHATIRHLILRGTPDDTLARLGHARQPAGQAVVPTLPALQGARDMHQALFGHGWDVGRDGLPCNQEELAYTLLTFGYVYLRGLRTLGLKLADADERACLHAWNVMGHLLGIRDELMAHTMEDAQLLFARMQRRGRAERLTPDPRPHLGQALMNTMERMIPLRLARPFPRLLTRHLCGKLTARDIGIDARVNLVSRLLFAVLLGLVRAIDATVRLVVPGFSISRFITRVVGRRFMAQVLMDESRPLKLPEPVKRQARATMLGWQHDRKAPQWMNRLETRLTADLAPLDLAPPPLHDPFR